MGGLFSSVIGGGEAEAETSPEVNFIHSSDEWKRYLKSVKEESPSKLMVIDFTATWCGPCKIMAPIFSSFAEKYSNVDFVKIDVDELSTVAQEYEVKAMPTFVFLKNGEVVDTLVGGHKKELEMKIQKHGGVSASA